MNIGEANVYHLSTGNVNLSQSDNYGGAANFRTIAIIISMTFVMNVQVKADHACKVLSID